MVTFEPSRSAVRAESIAFDSDALVGQAIPDCVYWIEGAGGSVKETGTRRDRVRGVDRNSDDRSPKNLKKKPKMRAAKSFDKRVKSTEAAAAAE